MANVIKCNCSGKCFAKKNGECTILNKEVFGKCAFQKQKRNVTNGKKYVDVV